MTQHISTPAWVNHMNHEFAFVTFGGGQKIARLKDGKFQEFLTVETFKNLVATRRIEGGMFDDGSMGKMWLQHPKRRTYDRVVFEPGNDSCGTALNLWTGFPYEPVEGPVGPFLEFVSGVICDGDEERVQYVLAWIAQLFQEPGKKPGTALVLRGEQGTGKTTFANILVKLCGEHAVVLSSATSLARNFNNHLFGKVLVVIEETPVGAKEANVVKDIITSGTLLFEPKGVDSFTGQNHIHLIQCTNERKAVYAHPDERRYVVLDVSPCHREDTVYFADLMDWFKSGGAPAVLHYLLHYDWSAVDLRVVPRTAGLLEQKLTSLPLIERAIYEMLCSGEVCDDRPWEQAHSRTFIVDRINNEYRRGKEAKVTPEQVGKRLKQLFSEVRCGRVTSGMRRDRSWVFPPLDVARRDFELFIGQAIDWGVDEGQADGERSDRVVRLVKPKEDDAA